MINLSHLTPTVHCLQGLTLKRERKRDQVTVTVEQLQLKRDNKTFREEGTRVLFSQQTKDINTTMKWSQVEKV